MKILITILRKLSIILVGVLSMLCILSTPVSAATGEYINTLNTKDLINLDTDTYTNIDATNSTNTKLTNLKDDGDRFIDTDAKGGARDIATTLARIAKDLKNIFYGVAMIYFLIITYQLLFSGNSDEAIGKFKKGIIWITIGLIIMQIAFALVANLFNEDINGELAGNFLQNIVAPLVLFLQTLASFFFLAIGIYAFYRLITANGNEETTKSAKMSVLYAIVGFIVIKISSVLVAGFYSNTCRQKFDTTVEDVSGALKICTAETNSLEGVSGVLFSIIKWANSFVAIAIVLMIIYVGVQVMTSNGDDEVLKKAKKAILYIFIGVLILIANYLILTFGLLQGVDIPNTETAIQLFTTKAHI